MHGSTRAWPVLLLALASSCFDAEFLLGVQCESDADCGPTLGCHDGHCGEAVPAPLADVSLTPQPSKRYVLTWTPAARAEFYEIYERLDAEAGPVERATVPADQLQFTLIVPLHLRGAASHELRACNAFGCTDTQVAGFLGARNDAIGRFEPPDQSVSFGQSVAMSDDGSTLVVGAFLPDSAQSHPVYVFVVDGAGNWGPARQLTVDDVDGTSQFGRVFALSGNGQVLAVGDSSDGGDAGAVHVFRRDASDDWSLEASLVSTNVAGGDHFGASVALDVDGTTLVAAAIDESSSAPLAGAVYVFGYDAASQDWSQRAKLEASNADAGDHFGASLSVSGDGSRVAIGAPDEDSSGADEPSDDTSVDAGAVYVFERDGADSWAERAYLKPPIIDAGDHFGRRLALSRMGTTLAIAAPDEDGSGMGLDGDPTDDGSVDAGAVHVFELVPELAGWVAQAYVKPTNLELGFGDNLALDGSGDVLAIANPLDRSHAVGLDGDPTSNSIDQPSGAVEVFTRQAGSWSPRAYVKAPDGDAHDFGGSNGHCVALAASSDALAVGAPAANGLVFLY